MDPWKRESFPPETVKMLLQSEISTVWRKLPSLWMLPYLWLTCMQSALRTVKLPSLKSQDPASGQLNVCAFLPCALIPNSMVVICFSSLCALRHASLKGQEFSEAGIIACAKGAPQGWWHGLTWGPKGRRPGLDSNPHCCKFQQTCSSY